MHFESFPYSNAFDVILCNGSNLLQLKNGLLCIKVAMSCSVALQTERELWYTYLVPAESLRALTDIIFPHYHAGCLESCVFSLFWKASWVELDIIPVDLLMDLWWFCLGMITRDAESDNDAARMNNEILVGMCILSVNGHSYYFYNSAALLLFTIP